MRTRETRRTRARSTPASVSTEPASNRAQTPEPSNTLVVPAVQTLDEGQQQSDATEAKLLNPEAVAQRQASRLQYHGLRGRQAIELAERSFHVQRPSWTPPQGAAGGTVTSYLSETSAQEELPSGKTLLMQSSLPLRSSVGSGQEEPVSLTLESNEGSYQPANPIVPMSFSANVAQGVSLPGGVQIAPTEASAPEAATLVGNDLVYPASAPDADFMLEPLPEGVAASWQLLSEDSLSENALQFTLPAGATLRLSSSSPETAEVVSGEEVLLIIPPARAVEANETTLPVTYSVDGDALVTHVDLSGSVDFPVLIDPEVGIAAGSYGGEEVWHGWSFTDSCCFTKEERANRLGFYTRNVPVREWGQEEIGAIGRGKPGAARITKVDLDNFEHYEQASESEGQAGFQGDDPNTHPSWSPEYLSGFGLLEEGNQWYTAGGNFAFSQFYMCADSGGGVGAYLCNEDYGAEGFVVRDQTTATSKYPNGTRITGATVWYEQSAAPSVSFSDGEEWFNSQTGQCASCTVNASDEGSGLASLEVEIPPVKELQPNEQVYANFPVCSAGPSGFTGCPPEVGGAKPNLTGSFFQGVTKTGDHEIGLRALDAAGLQTTVIGHLLVDNTSPTLKLSGPLSEANGKGIGGGGYALKIAAEDGSSSEPQSGVAEIEVFLDGHKVASQSGCAQRDGIHPECFDLSYEWTLDPEKYGAGAHTIEVRATDGVGNVETRSLSVTIVPATYEPVGPGAVNLKTGDFKLEATDVSIASAAAELNISRVYDSREPTQGEQGPLGPQWSLTLPDSSANGNWQSLKVLANGSVEATLANGTGANFAKSGAGYVSPPPFQNYTLTGPLGSSGEYEMTDAAGDATRFTYQVSSSGNNEGTVSLYTPASAVRAVATGPGGLDKVTYHYVTTSEGITEPSEVIGPEPSAGACTMLAKGCRALTFRYAANTNATGEGSSEWREYKGRLAAVDFTAWNPAKGEVSSTEVARYAYDAKGRLRAEWDPQIEASNDCGKSEQCSALKTTYGYDAEGHVTAVTPAGQQPTILTYGTIAADPNTGRLLKTYRAPASTALWTGGDPVDTAAPSLSGMPETGARMAASNGAWGDRPATFGYQWEDCNSVGEQCSLITGATDETYTPSSVDIGHTLRAVVTATNSAGSATATSGASALVPASPARAEYPLRTKWLSPVGITLGADGNLWFTETTHAGGAVGKITTAGAITEYPAEGHEPAGITSGPDNNLWFTEYLSNHVDRITTAGVSTVFSLPSNQSYDSSIVTGPDGNLWLISTENHVIDKINTKGEVLGEYVLPKGSRPSQLTVGLEKAVWFTDYGSSMIGKITMSGAITEYKLPVGSGPYGIVEGPDGNMWYTDSGTSKIGKITPTGTITEYRLPPSSSPHGITAGANGNLWYTVYEFGRIGEITTAGATTEYELPAGSLPVSIVSGPDGSLWYTDYGRDTIGKIAPEAEAATPAPGTTIDYDVPVSGSGAPKNLSASETAKWGQTDHPVEATAIFPPDEPQGWPASNYRRATVFYLDTYSQTVNVLPPDGALSTTEYYPGTQNVKRSLSADNRETALKAGASSAEVAEHLSSEYAYNEEGTELTSSLGPEHEVELRAGTEGEARKHVVYSYDENAPSEGGPYRAVTKTTEEPQLTGQTEPFEPHTVRDSYSGQENLGWKLDQPTSTTTIATGLRLTHSATYSSVTGAQVETRSPGGPTFSSAFGTEANEMHHPSGDAVDAYGNIWVSDAYGNRVLVFPPSEGSPKVVGSYGSGELNFSEPEGIAINQAADRVYIADRNNNRVEIYNEEGVHQGQLGKAGSGLGELSDPEGVALDASGDVWVADSGNNRIEEFSSSGKAERAFSECGSGSEQLSNPTGIAIYKGTVYVANAGHHLIDEFSETGICAGVIGEAGTGQGQFEELKFMAFGPNGNLYVADSAQSEIDEFTPSGTFLTSFGGTASGGGQVSEAEGVAFDSSGNVYVADSGNNRIEKWLASTGNEGARDGQTIYYSQGTEASVTACQNHPQWAGLACETEPVQQPEVPGLPELPVTTYTYNVFDEPTVSTSSSAGQTRTETDAYDAAGRLLSRQTVSSLGSNVPRVTDTYSPETGALVKQTTGSGSEEQSIESVFNSLGELESYTAEGDTTTYSYDIDGRLESFVDPKGSETYSYDPTSGELTGLTDSSLGTITASYDPEGLLLSEAYPGGLTAKYTYNALGEATGLEYEKTTKCSSNCTWYSDTVTPSIRGQWMSQTSTTSHEEYGYDEAGRLTEVRDRPLGKGCTTRVYTYDVAGNRTDLAAHPPNSEGNCSPTGGSEERHTYDTANRLLDAGISYGPFGDIKSLPAADAGGEELQSYFYANGQVAGQTQKEPPLVKGEAEKAQTLSYLLDPARRTLETVSTGTITRNEVAHYDGPGTSPAWLSYPPTSEWTRLIPGIRGTLVAEQFNTESPVIEISNLHGDIVGTASISETATKPATMEDSEFGVPSASSPGKYKWLGAGEFPTELPSGVISMGARSYVPQIGRFLQPDPNPGGSANAYAYTYGNPLNESDPSGEFPTYDGDGFVGEGEGLYGEGAGAEGSGLAAGATGAIVPPPAQAQEEEANEEFALYEDAGAGSEEYEEYEEEGGYEYASDHHDANEEAHVEPAVLDQPLGEASGLGAFGEEWRRILIEYGSRCEQYGGHWSGHRCVGVRRSRPSPAAKYLEKCVYGTTTYGIVGVLIDAVKVTPAGAAVSCFLGELAP